MVLFRAVPSSWPTDPKQKLAVLENVIAGGDMVQKEGSVKEVGWFSSERGYAIVESNSKDTVLGIVSAFFPLYAQDIHEIVPWDKAKDAFLKSAKMAAGSG